MDDRTLVIVSNILSKFHHVFNFYNDQANWAPTYKGAEHSTEGYREYPLEYGAKGLTRGPHLGTNCSERREVLGVLMCEIAARRSIDNIWRLAQSEAELCGVISVVICLCSPRERGKSAGRSEKTMLPFPFTLNET